MMRIVPFSMILVAAFMITTVMGCSPHRTLSETHGQSYSAIFRRQASPREGARPLAPMGISDARKIRSAYLEDEAEGGLGSVGSSATQPAITLSPL